jgi:DNA polymerase-1
MIVSVDAAQLEWRVAVELSKDEVALSEILRGEDTHDLNRVAFSLPSRLIAKIYLFRTIFRGSGWSFANDNDFMHVSDDPAFWDAVNEKFFKKYYGLDKQHKVWADIVMSGGLLEGPLGRKWKIELGRDRYGNIKIPWTTLTNYPVQGTGADIMSIARVSMRNKIRRYKLPVDLIHTVHDDIKIDCESKYVKDVVELYHQTFDDLPRNIKKMFDYEWKVPLKCECKTGMVMKSKWDKDKDGNNIIVCENGMEEYKL